VKNEIIKIEVAERVDFDHHPVVWIRGKVRRKRGKEGEEEGEIDRGEEVCGMKTEEKNL